MNNKTLVDDWMDTLQAHGYRKTRARRAIVQTMLDNPRGMEPLEIYSLGQKSCRNLGMVTVYRTLEKLNELGLIERMHQPQGCNLYIRATVGHQHLLVCRQCGRVAYFEGDDLSHLINRVEARSGYSITSHWLQLFGLCPICRQAETTTTEETPPDDSL